MHTQSTVKYTAGRDHKENEYRADLCYRAAQVSPLIAAAPELLEALQGAQDRLKHLANTDDDIDVALAVIHSAIAKATGGAS